MLDFIIIWTFISLNYFLYLSINDIEPSNNKYFIIVFDIIMLPAILVGLLFLYLSKKF